MGPALQAFYRQTFRRGVGPCAPPLTGDLLDMSFRGGPQGRRGNPFSPLSRLRRQLSQRESQATGADAPVRPNPPGLTRAVGDILFILFQLLLQVVKLRGGEKLPQGDPQAVADELDGQ